MKDDNLSCEKIEQERNYYVERENMIIEEFKKDRTFEYQHLIRDVLTNSNSDNNSINWFIDYKPVDTVNNSRNKNRLKSKINNDYIEHLYIDKLYKFKSSSTSYTQFPKFFVKFESGYKRYGCISIYGVRTSVIQDYYFYSKNVGEFFLNKIMFKEAFAYSISKNILRKIKFLNDTTINAEDIDDLYIICLSGDDHEFIEKLRHTKTTFFDFSKVVYDGIIPANLDIYKNDKLIKRISIKDYRYKINSNFIEIYNNNEIVKKYDILKL